MDISPYGYDKSMLRKHYGDLLPLEPDTSKQKQHRFELLKLYVPSSDSGPPEPESTDRGYFHLLRLPNEILLNILKHLLRRSYTLEDPFRPKGSIRWDISKPSILFTCRRLNQLGTTTLFSENEFVLRVRWHEAMLRFPSVPYSLEGTRQVPFPGALASRCIPLMKRILIGIEVADGYITSSKFNIGPRAIYEGVKRQVSHLCKSLSAVKEIHELSIKFQTQDLRLADSKRALESFKDMNNVKQFRLRMYTLDVLAARGDLVQERELYQEELKHTIEAQYIPFSLREPPQSAEPSPKSRVDTTVSYLTKHAVEGC
jgi:hypothetical protein